MQELGRDIKRLKHVVVDFLKPDKGEAVAHLRLFVHEGELPRAEAALRSFIGRKRLRANLMTMNHLRPAEFFPPAGKKRSVIRIRSGAVVVEGKIRDMGKIYAFIASLPGVSVPQRPPLEKM